MPPTRPQLEARLEAHFYNRVRLAGGLAVKLCPNVAGLPDRLVLFPGGRVYFVELKTERGSLRTIQKVLHRRLAELGSPCFVLYGLDEVNAWIGRVVESMAPIKPGRQPKAHVDPMFEGLLG